MEIPEEVVGSNDHGHIVKRKRTKRQRPPSPLPFGMASSSSSGGGGGGGSIGSGSGGGGGGDGGGDDRSSTSPTTSAELTESTEEEEDMANCLILLAQGHNRDGSKRINEEGGVMERFNSRRFTEATTTTTNVKAGFYVYECKTCNRCFPSFQALGGHRASHKKIKAMVEEKKALALMEDHETQFNNNCTPLSLQMVNRVPYSNNKSRVHECSICGSEFSSGQALGGHMRRHRTSTATTTTTTTTTTTMSPITTSESQEPEKQRNVLTLDLNLPAPEDDRESKFQFASKQQPLVFSAAALVDCHY